MDNNPCLGPLLASGLWSRRCSKLTDLKAIVLDGTSVAKSLYSIMQTFDENSIAVTTDNKVTQISNYVLYGELVNRLFDIFKQHQIKPIVVYNGTRLECKFGKIVPKKQISSQSRQRQLNERLQSLEEKQSPPDLLLTVFKQIVNNRCQTEKSGFSKHVRGSSANGRPMVVQAYYEVHPIIAKLARDNKCPVMTQRHDFLFTDVREGFILFDKFFYGYFQQTRGNSKTEVTCDRYFNHEFIYQHPGLSVRMGTFLLTLMRDDFIRQYRTNLARIKLDLGSTELDYGKTEKENNIDIRHHSINNGNSELRRIYAKRMELIIGWLANKSPDIVFNIIKGESLRTKTQFYKDFQLMTLEYIVAAEFKRRLAIILTNNGQNYLDVKNHGMKRSVTSSGKSVRLLDPLANLVVQYIEDCLIKRETTGEFILPLLSQQTDMSPSVILEDEKTKRSANSMGDRAKVLLAAQIDQLQIKIENQLNLQKNKPLEKSKSSPAISSGLNKSSQIKIRMHDRVEHFMRERCIVLERETVMTRQPHLMDWESLIKLSLGQRRPHENLAKKLVGEAFYFDSDWLRLADLKQAFESFLEISSNDNHDNGSMSEQLAIMMCLGKFCLFEASQGDEEFYKHYSPLFKIFLESLLYMLLYYFGRLLSRTLVARVDKIIAENAMQLHWLGSTRHEATNDPDSPHKQKNSIQIIQLIELLSSTTRAFCELNAFYNYPFKRLALNQYFNGSLLYNMMIFLKGSTTLTLLSSINEPLTKMIFHSNIVFTGEKNWNLNTHNFHSARSGGSQIDIQSDQTGGVKRMYQTNLLTRKKTKSLPNSTPKQPSDPSSASTVHVNSSSSPSANQMPKSAKKSSSVNPFSPLKPAAVTKSSSNLNEKKSRSLRRDKSTLSGSSSRSSSK